MSIDIAISEQPSSLPNLLAGNVVNNNNNNDSPTNKQKEGVERNVANIHPNRVEKSNQITTTDQIGTKTIHHANPPEITEALNSPARASTGIGVTKCPICGKQFGKSSLRFHQPQCEKRQAALQEKHELARIEEKHSSSYIIYNDLDGGKK